MPTNKQDKTRIVQIWGDILDEGFTSVPNLLLRYRSSLGIKPKHLTLIIDIMSFKWDRYSPFPSYSTLAKRAGIEERSIKRITQDLEELYLLIKEPRFDEETGAQITTIFDFRPLVKKLTEEMLKEDLYQDTGEEKTISISNKAVSKHLANHIGDHSGECVDEPEPVCGDGNQEAPEECDDGNNVNGDGCSNACFVEFCLRLIALINRIGGSEP
ncbi:MAG: helix-turn-helix domain-containing protein [Bacteroidetes bacterium]|nr:helix-turn-helix domain-containing protein [Bacteroidota bacterium]